jgi:hypothetical protein
LLRRILNDVARPIWMARRLPSRSFRRFAVAATAAFWWPRGALALGRAGDPRPRGRHATDAGGRGSSADGRPHLHRLARAAETSATTAARHTRIHAAAAHAATDAAAPAKAAAEATTKTAGAELRKRFADARQRERRDGESNQNRPPRLPRQGTPRLPNRALIGCAPCVA